MAVISLGSPLRDRILRARLNLQRANVLCARLALELEAHGTAADRRMLADLQQQIARAGRQIQQP